MLDSCLRLIGPFGAPLRSRGWREHSSLALTEWNRKREEGASHRASSVSATGKEPTTETALIFCVDFGDINIATFVAAIAAGGVLVVTKPGAHAATWVAKSLHLISTRCPLCCPAASRRVGAARRVVIVRRKFDAVALTVAAGCARTCPLCECVSVSATETNTVQEPVLRFSAGFGQLLFADVKLTKLGGGGTVRSRRCRLHHLDLVCGAGGGRRATATFFLRQGFNETTYDSKQRILDAVRRILHCILGSQEGGEVISLPL